MLFINLIFVIYSPICIFEYIYILIKYYVLSYICFYSVYLLICLSMNEFLRVRKLLHKALVKIKMYCIGDHHSISIHKLSCYLIVVRIYQRNLAACETCLAVFLYILYKHDQHYN